MKKEYVQQQGSTYIPVPFWWDADPESLMGTIQFYRPDIIVEKASEPIPLNPPSDHVLAHIVEGVGELMLATFAESTDQVPASLENPWWLGEKYDGVRCVWNSTQKQLYTRRGQRVRLPHSVFRECAATNSFFDCEAWIGRDSFTECLRTLKNFSTWEFVRLVAFDNPSVDVRNKPFELRYQHILQLGSPDVPFIILAVRLLCTQLQMMNALLETIIKHAGEGIILRKLKSISESGRSANLMKVKAAPGDMEALVVAIMEGKTCTLKLPNGLVFSAPLVNENSTKQLRTQPGDVVTVEYDRYVHAREVPVGARVLRVRPDLAWKDVLADYHNEPVKNKSERYTKFTKQSMRLALEDFARSQNKDPLVPQTWYTTSRASITQSVEAQHVLVHFNNNYIKALITLFPDVPLDPKQFLTVPMSYYSSIQNRRKTLEHYARANNFDPLIPENWYSKKVKYMRSTKGMRILLEHVYGNNMGLAIVHAFPEIKFDMSKYYKLRWSSSRYWADPINRRDFFRYICNGEEN